MADIKFKLEKDDLSRQIHYVLKELYPEANIAPETVHNLVIETAPDGAGFKFDAASMADMAGLDKEELTSGLYRGLGIEYEKNWHDKSYFDIKTVGGAIEFHVLNRMTDDKR